MGVSNSRATPLHIAQRIPYRGIPFAKLRNDDGVAVSMGSHQLLDSVVHAVHARKLEGFSISHVLLAVLCGYDGGRRHIQEVPRSVMSQSPRAQATSNPVRG